jgi:hypothetical protein
MASVGSPLLCAVPPRDDGAGPIAGFHRQTIFKSLKLSLVIWSSSE